MNSRTMSRVRLAVAAGVLTVFAGCASAGQSSATSDVKVDRAPRVQVRNDNWNEVTIFAIREGLSVRLGSVVTGGTDTFEVPPSMRQGVDVRLLVEPIASRTGYVSPILYWGEDMTLTVANVLAQSTLVPWRSAG